MAISNSDMQQALFQSGMFNNITPYLVIGDEPIAQANQGYTGALDVTQMIPPQDFPNIFYGLTYLPRIYLKQWFDQYIAPNIAKDPNGFPINYDLIWGGFINLFNQANVNYIQLNPYEYNPNTTATDLPRTPSSWESEKLEKFLLSQNPEASNALKNEISQIAAQTSLSSQARSLLSAYAALPKHGDLGLEISRQNAVNELLKQKEYATVQAIIDAYRYADQTSVGQAVKDKIPFTITGTDGRSVQATP